MGDTELHNDERELVRAYAPEAEPETLPRTRRLRTVYPAALDMEISELIGFIGTINESAWSAMTFGFDIWTGEYYVMDRLTFPARTLRLASYELRTATNPGDPNRLMAWFDYREPYRMVGCDERIAWDQRILDPVTLEWRTVELYRAADFGRLPSCGLLWA